MFIGSNGLICLNEKKINEDSLITSVYKNVTVVGKIRPRSPGKIRRKGEKFLKERSALKLHLMSLKLIVFQYNSFIQTSKISKNHFFSKTNISKCNNSQNI
jgi:hypothetical protein